MPLKILFADDSMTAQTMGVKILTEAGYEVVTVSNGSAALKKIAEQKPDIAILDVYMPGYNGLEVCEKMRNSIATLNTPVLLTVGKMEAYRNEDTDRVKADGVIVKPFEASDLVAMVKKLEERIFQPQPPPPAERTLYLERPTLLTDPFPRDAFSVDAGQTDSPQETQSRSSEKPHSELEIPDHMAGSPALSDSPAHDFLAPQMASPAPETALAEEAPLEPSATLPEPEPLAAWKREPDRQAETDSAGYVSPRDTQIMPAYQQPEAGNQPVAAIESAPEEAAVPAHPTIPTALASPESPTPETIMAAHSVLRESASPGPPVVFLQEHMAVHDNLDPALVTDRTQMTAFATRFGVENAEDVPVGVYAEQSWHEVPAAEPEPHPPAGPSVAGPEMAGASADDFEARVAAAMTAYDQPEAHSEAQPEVQPLALAEDIGHPEAQSAGHEDSYQAAQADPVPEVQAPAAHPETGIAASELQTYGDAVSAYSAAEPPGSAAASGIVADPEVIAQVVNRVLERLKPELIAEIVRELNSKK